MNKLSRHSFQFNFEKRTDYNSKCRRVVRKVANYDCAGEFDKVVSCDGAQLNLYLKDNSAHQEQDFIFHTALLISKTKTSEIVHARPHDSFSSFKFSPIAILISRLASLIITMQSYMDVMQFQALTTKSSEMFFFYSVINNIQINSYVAPLLGLAKTIYYSRIILLHKTFSCAVAFQNWCCGLSKRFSFLLRY